MEAIFTDKQLESAQATISSLMQRGIKPADINAKTPAQVLLKLSYILDFDHHLYGEILKFRKNNQGTLPNLKQLESLERDTLSNYVCSPDNLEVRSKEFKILYSSPVPPFYGFQSFRVNYIISDYKLQSLKSRTKVQRLFQHEKTL